MPSELNSRPLAIYLNDHLAGSTVGLELARRSARSNEGTPYGEFLATFAAEVEQDREQLQKLMAALGVREDKVKVAAGWTAEKFGRLKLNGQLRGYAPLSRLVELEGLRLGVTGKLELWRNLQRLFGEKVDGVDLEALAKRAQAQQRQISARHKSAADEAFAGESART
jgi:hypothetical protein